MSGRERLLAILDLARWAPSGDNSQPWLFRIVDEDQIQIIGIDHADTDVYDFDARPTMLTLGFLLETMAIAASKFGARIDASYRRDGEHRHLIDVIVIQDETVAPDPLLPYVEMRSVERGRYRAAPLNMAQQKALQDALGSELQVSWFVTAAQKWQVSRINARATHIRLSIPEAFAVHQRILDWRHEQSPDGVPSKAIGLDPMTLGSMQWVMQKWERAHFMNRFAGGTVVPRLEMDLLPGLLCGAHFMIFQNAQSRTLPVSERLLQNGRGLQRFWLTATALGLVMQPALAPLCFAYYAEHRRQFTTDAAMRDHADDLRVALKTLQQQASPDELVFMGRIGAPTSMAKRPRSVRKPLSALLQS